MQCKRLGLGMRFDFLRMVPDAQIERLVFEEIFSVLTLSDVKGYTVYGGVDPTAAAGENVYLAVLMGGKLGPMRRIYGKICDDAAITMYLCHDRPFLENNRLEQVEGLTCFGVIGADGYLQGGERALPLRIAKKRGKRRNVGRGIHILLAPAALEPIAALEAVKRLTYSARAYFPGVRILPFPITPQKPVQSLVRAAGGSLHYIAGAQGKIPYGVLRGKTAVIEASADSAVTGELIRRAMDEGLRHIYIAPAAVTDEGIGCARVLGARFLDAAGENTEDPARVASVDTELLHPMVQHTRFVLMQNGDGLTLGRLLTPLLRLRAEDAVEAMLNAADFERLLTGKALVMTGGTDIRDPQSDGARALKSVASRCAVFRVPVVAMTCSGWEEPEVLDEAVADVMGVVKTPLCADMTPEEAGAEFDMVANRIFRFIRLGRDVEKIGAPKREPARFKRLPLAIRRRIDERLSKGEEDWEEPKQET